MTRSWMRTAVGALVLVCGGCARATAPAMIPRVDQQVARIPDGMARIVFVRPATACDTADHAVVVDESGKFLANLSRGTAFAADLPPGRHAFFLWPGMDQRTDKSDNFQPVSVLDVQQDAGTALTATIDVARPTMGRGRCYRSNVYYFQSPPEAFNAGSLPGVRLVDVDKAASQAYFSDRKELSAAYFEMARGKLIEKRNREAEAARRAERSKKIGLAD